MKTRIIVLVAAGLALLPALAGANPVPVAEPTWVASPPIADTGEPISLFFCNTTPDTVVLSSSAPWWIEDDFGSPVYTPVATLALVDVPPGGCPGWYWDQKDDGGNQVPPGIYHAKIDWEYKHIPGPQTSSSQFAIGEYVSFDVTLTHYIGPPDTVLGTMENWGLDDTVFVVDGKPWYITDLDDNIVFDPPPDPIVITPYPPGFVHDIVADLDTYGFTLDPGLYKMWYRFLRGVARDPMSLFDRFAVTDPPQGAAVWTVTPKLNLTRSVVHLTFTNASVDTMYLPNTHPYWIEDDVGNPVFSPVSGQAIQVVPPGTTRSWAWPEMDDSLRWVGPGDYTAKVKWAYTMAPWDTAAYDFTLYSVTDFPACLFVETSKRAYSSGEQVDFDFTNCAPDTVGMRAIHMWWVMHASGVLVYAPIVLWAHTSFAPMDGFPDQWDQSYFLGGQVPDGIYYIVCSITDKFYATETLVMSPPFVIGPSPTGIGDMPAIGAWLEQNIPNPFNPATTIRYSIDGPGPVTLQVYDVAGRLVRTLVKDSYAAAGPAAVTWDGRDNAGAKVASGVYLYRLESGDFKKTRKLVLVK
jgi:hypothetical protein